MTNQEFSDEFDTLLNSYSINSNFAKQDQVPIQLDEYEKSVYLTKSQELIVLELYSGRNNTGISFENKEESRELLKDLLKTYSTQDSIQDIQNQISANSYFFEVPEDILFITFEQVLINEDSPCLKNKTLQVKPITQDEYFHIINNPFKGINDNRVLRIDYDTNIKELISKYQIQQYYIKYLQKPLPIILTNLGDDISINGLNEETSCKLNPILHRAILERAVNLAIQSKTLYLNNK